MVLNLYEYKFMNMNECPTQPEEMCVSILLRRKTAVVLMEVLMMVAWYCDKYYRDAVFSAEPDWRQWNPVHFINVANTSQPPTASGQYLDCDLPRNYASIRNNHQSTTIYSGL